jgi:hypothetical protein
VDPNMALRWILQQLSALRKDVDDKAIREECMAILMELRNWLRNGGFAPDVETVCRQFLSSEIKDTLSELLEWSHATGGWEAPVWNKVRRLRDEIGGKV